MQLNTSKIYFLGIGGIGMCGLAELLHNMGAEVWGSDPQDNANTQRLKDIGIKVLHEHKAENIEGADVVVYSSAIKSNHVEILAARDEKIPIIRRAEVLAEVMRLKRGIAVAGSHGKTTTTSLIATALIGSGMKPTVVVGGRLDLIKSTSVLGEGSWLVAEADESDGSFLNLNPELAVITNIDNDHMDFYKSDKDLEEAFYAFAEKIPFYGKVFVCGDDERVKTTFTNFPKNILTYGFNENNDFRITGSQSNYQIEWEGSVIFQYHSPLPGKHNALNTAVSLLISREVGADIEKAKLALDQFSGVGRRFELIGNYNSVPVYDDYAHHPTEIKATLNAFQEKFPDKNLRLVFQPHRYSRTELCWSDFASSFEGVSELILLPIYAAGESPITNINSEELLKTISVDNKKTLPDATSVKNYLIEDLKTGDVLITFGAGDIYKLAKEIAHA